MQLRFLPFKTKSSMPRAEETDKRRNLPNCMVVIRLGQKLFGRRSSRRVKHLRRLALKKLFMKGHNEGRNRLFQKDWSVSEKASVWLVNVNEKLRMHSG